MSKHCVAWVLSGILAGLSAVACTPSTATPSARAPSFAEFDRRALAGEKLSVVFFGASLTWGANATDPQHTSYRAVIERKLQAAYPKAHFRCYDSSIGSPGSDLGVFRFDRDVLGRKPDLIFLGFSPNDGGGKAYPGRLATWEAIMRRSIVDARIPVVAVLFPFQWNVQGRKDTKHLHGDAERIKIAAAYNVPVGNATALMVQRINAKETTVKEYWPWDGVHVSDHGYAAFADAAWAALRGAIRDNVVCKVPEKMFRADYSRAARVRISSLKPLPKGWTVGKPLVNSATYDWLMSRWLDDVVVVRQPGARPKKGKPAPKRGPVVAQARLKVRFSGTDVFLFGQSTRASCRYRVYVDGKKVAENDAGQMAKRVNGETFLWQDLARNLSADKEHTLEIEPIFEAGKKQEFMPESICVSGGKAWVKPAK